MHDRRARRSVPVFFMVLSGLRIADPSGELILRFPPTTYPTGTLYLQSMHITSNPGYGPAAFSNVIRI